jgi:hypothetical protein
MLQRSQLIIVNFLIRYLTNLLKASCISAGLGFLLFGSLLFLLMFSTRHDGSLPDNSLADLFVKLLATMADPSGQGNFEGGPVELGAAIYLFLLPYLSIASIILTVLREITQKDLLARITPSLSDALRGGLIFNSWNRPYLSFSGAVSSGCRQLGSVGRHSPNWPQPPSGLQQATGSRQIHRSLQLGDRQYRSSDSSPESRAPATKSLKYFRHRHTLTSPACLDSPSRCGCHRARYEFQSDRSPTRSGPPKQD